MTAGAWTRIRRFGPLVLVLGLVVWAFASGLAGHLSLSELRTRHLALEDQVRAHPWLSLAGYVVAYTVVVALSIPAALVFTLTGGLLFGPWIGGGAATASCTLGAGVIFLICRSAAGDVLQRRAGPMAARIEASVRRDAFAYIILLRLAPIMPFWLANLALGLIDIPLPTFLAASCIGIAPVSLVFAGIGASLNTVFATGGRPHLHVMLRPAVFVPLIGLALLSIVPIAARRLRKSDKA